MEVVKTIKQQAYPKPMTEGTLSPGILQVLTEMCPKMQVFKTIGL